jgi:hypothetical protein
VNTIEQRLERLERKDRRQTRIIGCMGIALVALMCAGWSGRVGDMTAATLTADRVVASKLDVVNAAGEVVVEIAPRASGGADVKMLGPGAKDLFSVSTDNESAALRTYQNDQVRMEITGGPAAGLTIKDMGGKKMVELGAVGNELSFLTLYQADKSRMSLIGGEGPLFRMMRGTGDDMILELKSQSGMGVATLFKDARPTVSLTGTSTFAGMITTHDNLGHVITKLGQGGSGGGLLDISSSQGHVIHALRATADGDGLQYIQNAQGQPLVILGSAAASQGAVNVLKDRKVEWSIPSAFHFGGG